MTGRVVVALAQSLDRSLHARLGMAGHRQQLFLQFRQVLIEWPHGASLSQTAGQRNAEFCEQYVTLLLTTAHRLSTKPTTTVTYCSLGS